MDTYQSKFPTLPGMDHPAVPDLSRRTTSNSRVDPLCGPSAEAPAYYEYVRRHVLRDTGIPVPERYRLLTDAARPVLTPVLVHRNVDDVVRGSAEFGQDLATLVSDCRDGTRDLLAVMSHDLSRFTHVTNVGTVSVMLAEACGCHDKAPLIEIAQGALMHDLGKQFLPRVRARKGALLSQEQNESIVRHPTLGFENLCLRPEVSWGQLMMVYQHHERCDGTGYPGRLVGKEIHEWGRLCAVADVYAVLTRDRPYRKGPDTKEVVEYLGRQSGHGLDEEISQCLIAALKTS